MNSFTERPPEDTQTLDLETAAEEKMSSFSAPDGKRRFRLRSYTDNPYGVSPSRRLYGEYRS